MARNGPLRPPGLCLPAPAATSDALRSGGHWLPNSPPRSSQPLNHGQVQNQFYVAAGTETPGQGPGLGEVVLPSV